MAWGTSDLFRAGAPIGPFFSLLTRLDCLRWFQSPAAGFDAPVFAELARRGVRITNAHVNSLPIAEFVMRAVLDEFQGAREWRRLAGERSWRIHDWREVSGIHLAGGRAWAGSAPRWPCGPGPSGPRVIGCRRRPSAG